MKVLVSGVGIAGLTVAGRLGALGHPVRVVERAAVTAVDHRADGGVGAAGRRHHRRRRPADRRGRHPLDRARPGLRRRGRVCLIDTVGRQVGCYGLRDGRVAAFTVHRTPHPTRPDDPRAAVRAAYATLGWIVPRVLERCPPKIYYDQVARVELPRWSRGRVVLVGDACGAVSLPAGQGASLGMGGAYVLAENVTDLVAYERRRRPVVVDRQRVARAGARWFLPATRTRLRARRVALRPARLPWVDRRIATSLVGKPTALVGD